MPSVRDCQLRGTYCDVLTRHRRGRSAARRPRAGQRACADRAPPPPARAPSPHDAGKRRGVLRTPLAIGNAAASPECGCADMRWAPRAIASLRCRRRRLGPGEAAGRARPVRLGERKHARRAGLARTHRLRVPAGGKRTCSVVLLGTPACAASRLRISRPCRARRAASPRQQRQRLHSRSPAANPLARGQPSGFLA